MTDDGSDETHDTPRVLYDMQPLIADNRAAATGVAWRLAEAGRQLDANVLNLPAGTRIDTHTEPDLDVLVVVIAGSGTLTTDDGPLPLTPGSVVWLPHGSTRSLAAGADGLSYLTTHRRRPGMQIHPGPPQAHRRYASSAESTQ
jgi:quercetin dioxygenase-like cupin family protein